MIGFALLAASTSPSAGGCGASPAKRAADRQQVRAAQLEAMVVTGRREAADLRGQVEALKAQLADVNRQVRSNPPAAVVVPPPPPAPPPGPPEDAVAGYEQKIQQLREQVRTLGRTLDLKDEQVAALRRQLDAADRK